MRLSVVLASSSRNRHESQFKISINPRYIETILQFRNFLPIKVDTFKRSIEESHSVFTFHVAAYRRPYVSFMNMGRASEANRMGYLFICLTYGTLVAVSDVFCVFGGGRAQA